MSAAGALGMAFHIDSKKASKTSPKWMDYGTAGFRSKAEDLDHVMYRTGMLAALRSKKMKGETVGLMITASHNPECDNGVKLIDPNGEMLQHSWESLATLLINTEDEDLERIVQKIADDEQIDWNCGASVYVGRDTRSSSPKLAQLAVSGVAAFNGRCRDYGIVTTPVLHYMVSCKNQNSGDGPVPNSGDPTEKDYNDKLINSFRLLNKMPMKRDGYDPELILDCSNGVGSTKAKQVSNDISEILKIHIYNDGNGTLNHKCGADFVKVNQTTPEGIPTQVRKRCAAFDGDADRLIYFFVDDEGRFLMLDGDRIAILLAEYIMELIRESNVRLNVGLVQTAYANGSSTDYITNRLKVPVSCVPTGVKHLHHKAKEFDVGIYFEANGHGTIVYSDGAREKVRAAADCGDGRPESRNAAERLWHFIGLTNQTVGDALSDLLLVETALRAKDWSVADWRRCYVDLPNRLTKVTVKDRNVIKTTDAERVCTSPAGLQGEIDKLVRRYSKGRAFVRPSGTEDVVRVYSEASTQAEADELGLEVASMVHRMAGGVGSPPTG